MRNDPNLTVARARRAWPFPPAFMARLADRAEIGRRTSELTEMIHGGEDGLLSPISRLDGCNSTPREPATAAEPSGGY
jgi:hypothetical protein